MTRNGDAPKYVHRVQQELLKALPSDPRYAPTLRRLAKRLGRGGNCVSRTLRSFEKRGLVARRTADKSDQNGKVGLGDIAGTWLFIQAFI